MPDTTLYTTAFILVAMLLPDLAFAGRNGFPLVSGALPINTTYVGYVNYTGPAFPGGPTRNISGPASSILAALHTLNPNYDNEVWPKDHNMSFDDMLSVRSADVQKRWTDRPDTYACGVASFQGINLNSVSCWEATARIRSLPNSGLAVMGAGPGACYRVECAYKVGLAWCNDVSQVCRQPDAD